MKLTSPSRVKEILDQYGLKTKKKLGQNFIVDENVLKKIIKVASLKKDDIVLEVGAGIGTLTEALANKVNKVIAVEIDEDMIKILGDTILKEYENVTLIKEDALKVDLEKIIETGEKKIKVVANLPYYITTPLLIKLALVSIPLSDLVLTVQKDAAERFLAKKGDSEYGATTVILEYFFKKEFVMKLSPGVFFPPPRVDSAIIRLESHQYPPVEVKDEKLFVEFVRLSFSKRRKTLKNNLKSFLPLEQEEIIYLLEKSDIGIKSRPQDLDVFEFAKIFNMVYNEYGYFYQ